MILALLPGPAWAAACDAEHPGWDGAPVGIWAETVLLMSTLPALILIAATLLAWRWRSAHGGLAVVLLWSFLVTAVVSWDPEGLRDAALAEGCRGDPILFIGLVIAICIATVLYTAPNTPRSPDGE